MCIICNNLTPERCRSFLHVKMWQYRTFRTVLDTKALLQLNTGLTKTEKLYTTIRAIGITSTYIPDIIAAMPINTLLRMPLNNEICENASNKLSMLSVKAGILTIEKAENGYTRTIITINNSGGSNGSIYIGNINTITKIINGWYKIEGTPC